ncbi:MAG TPA: diacylglycerol kinase family protein [Solirubrobacterales bacterium]|nr:diacylglycerol kinase family protein [Solirubrobacterales bacterium]
MVNPQAAGGRTLKLLPEVERELERRAIPHRIIPTRSLEHGVSEARRAVEVGEIPVVMSGDGLIGQIGGALANSGSPLGIIPGGRGNDLARVLGIPSDPAGSVATLAEGHVREIDVGEANGRRFLGIASCGFDSDANRIANEARLIRGNLVYAYAALRALAAWRHARFTITLDGSRTIELVGYSVVVANSRAYGGGMLIAPDAELDDGKFDVVLTGEAGKLRFLANLPKVFKGTHVENEEVQVLRASEVEIEADRDFAVYADGDHLTDLPARLGTLKRALRVIAPPPSA